VLITHSLFFCEENLQLRSWYS